MFRRKNKDTHSSDQHYGDTASHGHTHGGVDPAVISDASGIWATKVSLIALLATRLFRSG